MKLTRMALGVVAAAGLGLGSVACTSAPPDNSPVPPANSASVQPEEAEPVHLEFYSLAWQPPSIEANKRIIEQWNSQHPKIQVEYVQGDWGSVADVLTTGFEAGTAPDLFQFWDGGLQAYAVRGNLLNLEGLLSEGFVADIRQDAWENVSFDRAKGVWGVPFLQEPTLVFANKRLLDEAGVAVPSADQPWTWDQYAEVAKSLTVDSDGDGNPETWGAAIPLLEGGTDRTISLGLSFGAQYFNDAGTELVWGSAEQEIPQRLHALMYRDRSMSTDVLGLGPADIIPPFFEGQYATIFGGTFIRQQFTEGAPEGFEWVTIPPLMGTSQNQSNVAQTVSIVAGTEHPKEAVEFLEYLLSPENQVQLALGDWLTPTSIAAGQSPELSDPAIGWDVSIAASEHLVQSNHQRAAGYDEWASKVANQAFTEFYADQITIDQLRDRLVADGNPVLERAATR